MSVRREKNVRIAAASRARRFAQLHTDMLYLRSSRSLSDEPLAERRLQGLAAHEADI